MSRAASRRGEDPEAKAVSGHVELDVPDPGDDVEVAAEFRAKLRDTFGFETDMKHFAIFGRCKDCTAKNGTGKTSAESSITES